MMSGLRRPGIGALLGVAAGVGGGLVPASPAAAHQVYLGTPGGQGRVEVTPNHDHSWVCAVQPGARVTGEFLVSTLVVFRRTVVGECAFDDYGEEILRVRACDSRGCTAWKDT